MAVRRRHRPQPRRRAMHRAVPRRRPPALPVPPEESPLRRRTPPAHLLGSGLIPGQFEQQGADLEHDYTSRLAELAGGERNLYRDAGFRGQIDPTTGQVQYSTDPTATFGKYQTMLRSLAESLTDARSNALSRGLGGGGLSQARAGLARFAGAQDQAGLMQDFMGSAADIYRQRGEALTTRNRGRTALEGQALEWWNENAPPDYGNPAPIPHRPGGPANPGHFQRPGGHQIEGEEGYLPPGPERVRRTHQHVTRMARARYFPHRRRRR